MITTVIAVAGKLKKSEANFMKINPIVVVTFVNLLEGLKAKVCDLQKNHLYNH